MKQNQQTKDFRRRILTEREVRQMARALKKMLGEPFLNVTAHYGVSFADGIRFMAVSAHLVEAREAKGLTLKALAKDLGVPQYLVAEIERGSTKHLDASVLARYIDRMELREWYSQWESANRGLAKRLKAPEAGNPTHSKKRSRALRPAAGRQNK